jgi:S1-C subfamily serine protease
MHLATALIIAALAPTQDEDKAHAAVAEKVRPSLVAVRSLAVLGERSGTGVFLDEEGLIMTSYWIVPEGASNIRVWTHEPKLYTAEVVAHSKPDEITLIRIKPKGKTAPITTSRSSKVKIGEVSYTYGNAYNSYINDNSPAFNFGIISGFYNLKEAKANSYYKGWVFESTAAVNWGMEGAPLLNSKGKMIGMITLNYSPHRWLGNAIPIDALTARIAQLVRERKVADTPDALEGAGYIGMTVKQEGDKVVADVIDPNGPAQAAGIRKGDAIVKARGREIKSAAEFDAALKDLKAGDLIWITVDFGGLSQEVKIELTAPPKKEKK